MKTNENRNVLEKYLRKDLLPEKNLLHEYEGDDKKLTFDNRVIKDSDKPIDYLDRSNVDSEGGTGDLSIR